MLEEEARNLAQQFNAQTLEIVHFHLLGRLQDHNITYIIHLQDNHTLDISHMALNISILLN